MVSINYDINIKAKIDNFSEYEEKIGSIANFIEENHKEVYHFSSKNIDFNNIRSPDKFRVIKKNDKYIVKFRKLIQDTGKGIDIVEDKKFETNDFENIKELFEALGFIIFITEIKKTKKYHHKENKNLIIKLTEINELGSFIELDFPCRTEHDKEFAKIKVKKVFDDLGINKEMIENKYYLQMLLDIKK